MSTKFISPNWRMPRNANQNREANYSMFGTTSQKVDISNVPLGSKSWTISFWYQQSNFASAFDVWDMQYDDGNAGGGLKIKQQNGGSGATYLYFQGYGQGNFFQFNTQKVITDDNWFHIILRFNQGTDYRLYVNGVLSGLTTSRNGEVWPATRNLILFDGVINVHLDQFCVFDYALSDTATSVGDTATGQIADLWGGGTAVSNPMALPRTPKAYYPLGTSAWNGQYLVENNAIGDYVFDYTTTSNVSLGSAIDLGKRNTQSLWIKKDAIADQYWFGDTSTSYTVSAYATSGNNAGFFIRPATGGSQVLANNSDVITAMNNTDSNWVNWTFVRDSDTTMRIFADGVFLQSITGANWASYNTLNILQTTNFRIDGKLSNITLFDTNLSDAEVATLYNYGSPIKTLANIPQSSNLKAWYKLDASEVYNSVSTKWEVSNATAAIKNTIFDPANSSGTPCYKENTAGGLLPLTGVAGQSTTIALWYYAAGNADNVIFNRLENGAYWFGKQTSNNLRFLFTNNSGWTLGPSVPRDQWNHIVLTVVEGGTGVGRTVKFYVNGGSPTTVTDSSGNLSNITSQKNQFGSIGYSSTASTDVLSSNYVYYNTALSDSEVVSLYNSFSPDSENTPTVQPDLSSFPKNSNITGWFKSDGLDSSGQGNNGSAQGDIILGPAVSLTNGASSGMSQSNLVQSDLQTVAPYSKYAMNFDGTDDHIDCGNNSSLKITSNFSVSAWVKSSDQKSFAVAVGNNSVFSLQMSDSLNEFRFNVFSPALVAATYSLNPIDDGKWHHVVGTHDGSTIKIYVDNIKGTDASAGAVGSNTAPFLIGYLPGNSGLYFNGQISNVSYWNTALTQTQVAELYNEGLPSNLNSYSAYSNLVSWWQLGESSSFDGNDWIVADEKGTNNGTSTGMPVGALVNGVGTTANGTSSGMSETSLVGNAPYSTANAISSNMAATAKGIGVPFSYLLNDSGNASGAYSLRRLDSTYTGDIIRVRRSSDNAETNIGLNSYNVLDTVSLLNFLGSNDGFVTTWYDQSGNNNNFVQTTAADQPKIAESGVVTLENGKPTIKFDSGNTLEYNSNISIITLFSVYQLNSPTAFSQPISNSGGSLYLNVNDFPYNDFISAYFGGDLKDPNTTTANQSLRYLLANSSSSEIGTNGTTRTGTLGVFNSTVHIFRSGSGSFQELVLYGVNKSSSRSLIESNINKYYSIY